MKTIYKQVLLVISLVVCLFSCEEDDNVNFILQEASEAIEFTNTFSATYLLSNETSANIAERLVWNPVSFGQPTVITYTLEGSADNTSFEQISSTTETNVAVTVGRLLQFAEDMGLDNDPNTDDGSGNPNNTGVVYLRVNAAPGDGSASNSPTTVSEVVQLNISIIELQEQMDPGLDPITVSAFGLVGDLINEFGGNDTPDIPLYTRGDGVHFAAFNNPGEGSLFKIRENNDWTLPNYGPGSEPGTLSTDSGFDNLIFPAGDILIISVDLNNLTISVETGDSWGVVGDVINDFGGTGDPDIRLTEDPEQPGLWFALSIELEAGQTKFRLNNDWTNNWGPDGSGGLSMGSFDNFQVDAGTYNITLDLRTSGSESGGFEQQ
ncbi:MAG: SusE domain-containing protein [Bacteroidota bacterium]